MRIIQITDLHIGQAGELPFAIDVRANFLRILDVIKDIPHDLLVISGDLCFEDGEPAIYQWIKTQLDNFQLNYLVIPGNHDDTQMMVDSFGLDKYLRRGELFISSPADQPPLVLLDSGPGTISITSQKLLQQFLTEHQAPVCLFMHHPPRPMGVPYMDDRHAFQDTGATFESLLTAHPYPIHIFTGHYHVDKSLYWKNLTIHVTPSCFFQIDWRQKEFAVDHHRIAYRQLTWDGESLLHSVVYLD